MATKAFTKNEIQGLLITHKTDIAPLMPIITINESIFAIKGGMSMVTGKTGSGKTTKLRVIIGQALRNPVAPPRIDNLNLHVEPANGKPVIYLNTEMPNASLKRKIHDAVLSDLGIDETPENFKVVQAMSLSFDERRRLIVGLLQEYQDTHLLIIDGGADTVPSVNDEAKSVEAIEELNKLANEYNTTIINVVHENKANGLTRGHYGQHCERKATGVASVKYDSKRKCFTISPVKIRESAPFPEIDFEFLPNGRVSQLSPATSTQRKVEAQTDELLKLVITCFKDEEGHRIKSRQFVNRLVQVGNLSENTARRRKDEMLNRNLVTILDGHFKCLVPIEGSVVPPEIGQKQKPPEPPNLFLHTHISI